MYALGPTDGHVLSSVAIQSYPNTAADGFTVLPNGDFPINDGDAVGTYRSYSGITGARAGIRERVAEILQDREQIDAEGTKLAIERTAIDKEWVIERLRENVERAMQAQPVIDRAGNPTGSYVYNGAAANRALELLGKELGMFIERRLSKQTDDITEGTPDERRATAARLVAEAFAEIMKRPAPARIEHIEVNTEATSVDGDSQAIYNASDGKSDTG